jgi:hypothetical protein
VINIGWIPKTKPGESKLTSRNKGRTERERGKNARRLQRRAARDNGQVIGRTLK